MSTTTNNFGITLPEGIDTFNPLTFNNDAFTQIDSEMRTIKNATVGSANHVLSENINTITRSDSNTNTFIFIASSDYGATQNFYVDGVPVNVRYSDGSAPINGAYRTNQAVLCHLNGNILTIFIHSTESKSYVGMIIYSRTLDTEEKVREFYGPGSWVQITGQFLLGQSSTYPVGSVGGEATHTLTINEMPKHSHNLHGSPNQGGTTSVSLNATLIGNNKFKTDGFVGSTGGTAPHNNMPPYRAVYIWERVN